MRGCSEDMSDPESMIAHVYTLLRSSKQKRRPFLRTIINQFTDRVGTSTHAHTHTHTQGLLSCTLLSPTTTPQRNSVHYLLYLADNLAYFPYNTLEEPLFVIHETDMAMAVHGAAVYQGFREVRTCREAMVSTMVPSTCTLNSLEMEMSASSFCS